MTLSIAYMGTKRQLASAVAEVIASAKPGPLFDVFSGMCSVGQEVAPVRQIWTNDVQKFAAEVGAAIFTSKEGSVDAARLGMLVSHDYSSKSKKLFHAYKASIRAEAASLNADSYKSFSTLSHQLSLSLADDKPKRRSKNHNLFTTTYANTYFGLKQAISIDSIYFALSRAFDANNISVDQRRWALIALGKAILKLSNSTGHFAQYLKPKENSLRTYLRQRNRCVWSEWLTELSTMSSVGTPKWRSKNKAFNSDSIELLESFKTERTLPGVVYADPPYTDDQYSRYYHILETLMLYDYPSTSGAGLYRGGRFTTPFSKKTLAPTAIEDLIKATAEIGADLVLSYPTNGLLHEAGVNPKNVLKKYFSHVEIGHSQRHAHSTFGASKGNAQETVIERIYFATS